MRTYKIVNGDVVRSTASGSLVFVEGLDKSRQAMARLLSLNAPKGAGLNQLVGSVPDSAAALSARVQRNIRQAFDARVDIEQRFRLSSRTPDERLSTITRMYVVPADTGGGNSKTGYAFRVDAVTASGATASTTGVIVVQDGG